MFILVACSTQLGIFLFDSLITKTTFIWPNVPSHDDDDDDGDDDDDDYDDDDDDGD